MNSDFFRIFRDYKEITLRYDTHYRAIWCYYNPSPRPCFSSAMLQEIRQWQQSVIDYFDTKKTDSESPIRYLILYSQIPGIFSLGGDLSLFSRLIKEKNRQQLLDYALQCVDTCYLNSVNLHLPVTTITLVEGTALGGGFECALSSNTLIATKDSEMGFPEIRFNLFPGMGAYSLLTRACGMGIAERMLTSGATYSAEELYEFGIVDHLCESGKGIESVEKFMRRHQQSDNGHSAMRQIRQRYHPMNYQEFEDITEIWVDTALRLGDKDLRLMDRLVTAQSLKISKQKTDKSLLRTKQDRRFFVEKNTFPLVDWAGQTVLSDRRRNPERRLFN